MCHVLCERDARLHRHPFDGDEGDDVDGPEARMLACVGAQVDGRERARVQREDRRLDRIGVARHREDGPVVGRIRRMVEQADARYRADGGGDRLDHLGPAPLADIRNALNDCHGMRV